MNLARDLFFWFEDGKPHCRVRTNASKAMLVKRLRDLGIGEAVEVVEVFEDLLRLNGGNYVIVRWSGDVAAALLREKLIEL